MDGRRGAEIQLFKLEKQRQNKNGIAKLSLNGTIVNNPKDIAEICEQFYKVL